MGIPASLPDTERIVEWDELPENVRQIPPDFDPFAEGVLMKHQSDWIRMQQDLDIAVCERPSHGHHVCASPDRHNHRRHRQGGKRQQRVVHGRHP